MTLAFYWFYGTIKTNQHHQTMKKLALLLALMVATGTFKAYAQLVAEYTFTGDVATPSYVNYVVLSSASAVNGGSGQTVGFQNGQSAFPDRARWIRNWTTDPISPNLNQHFRFTLASSLSADVTITGIQFKEMRSDAGPRTVQMRTSEDGFTSVLWQQTLPDNGNWRTWNIVTSLTMPSDVEMRLYAFNNEGISADGAWRIDNLRIFANITNLPIELLSFTGEKINESKVKLLWSTASERDNDYFTVFRCNDLVTWQEIGRVPGAGSSQSRIDYELVDASPFVGTNYYKLRQTDFDETFVDSDIIAVDVDVGNIFVAFPNPTARGQPIRASKKVDFIIDQIGKLVPFDPLHIIIETPGVYTLVHLDENGFSTNCRVVVTH